MVTPLNALLAIQGTQAGLQLLGLDPASRAAKREQDFFRQNLAQRQAMFDELQIARDGPVVSVRRR